MQSYTPLLSASVPLSTDQLMKPTKSTIHIDPTWYNTISKETKAIDTGPPFHVSPELWDGLQPVTINLLSLCVTVGAIAETPAQEGAAGDRTSDLLTHRMCLDH